LTGVVCRGLLVADDLSALWTLLGDDRAAAVDHGGKSLLGEGAHSLFAGKPNDRGHVGTISVPDPGVVR